MSGQPWTDDDVALLRAVYYETPWAELLVMFPIPGGFRSVLSIKIKARRIGLRRRHFILPRGFYAQILNEFAVDKITVIAARHGVPDGTVCSWVARAKRLRDAGREVAAWTRS